MVINTAIPALTGQVPEEIPKDYFSNPESMFEFQATAFEKHLKKIDDDYVPYHWPWYGVSVVADYFGSKTTFPKFGDPAAFPIIDTIEEAKKLRLKKFEEGDLMKRTIDTIKYLKKNSEYPVSIGDNQSPLDVISLVIGYQNVFYWMKDDPGLVNHLMDLMSDAVSSWTKFQKEIIGEANDHSSGLLSIKPPEGIGTWFSDDDIVILSPSLYEDFVVPNYNKLFKEFGKVIVHWCGNGNHNVHNITAIENVGAVHNFFLGEIDSVSILQKKLKKANIPLIIGDIVPVKEELNDYLISITQNLDPVGLILNFWIYPRIGLKDGKYTYTEQDPIEIALRIIDHFRG